MTLEQWVNLPKDAKFTKDGDGASLDRCGKVTIEAIFKKDDIPISYKVKVTPVGSENVEYNKKEKKRNTNFRITKGTRGLSDKKSVLLEESVQLPAAGGNTYKIEAKDANGKVATSTVEVITKRKLYYQVISMDDGKTNKVPRYSLSSMENDALSHHIKIIKKGVNKNIPYLKTVTMQNSGSNLTNFGQHVVKAFSLDKELKKVGVAAVFSEYIASMSSALIKEVVTIGIVNPKCTWNSVEVLLIGNAYLWYGLNDAEDKAKKWLINAGVEYTDPAKGEKKTYRIPRANIDIAGTKLKTYGGYHKLKIKIDPPLQKLLSKTKGKLKFVANVHVASGWINGFSWNPGGGDLITCARRIVWEDMPSNTQEYTWNHEVGHRFGMTAWGNSKQGKKTRRDRLPDGPPTLYGENRGVNDKSHSGPHCEKGVTYNSVSRAWSGTPGCVMFGANGIDKKHAPKEYCSECKPIVRKVDLSAL